MACDQLRNLREAEQSLKKRGINYLQILNADLVAAQDIPEVEAVLCHGIALQQAHRKGWCLWRCDRTPLLTRKKNTFPVLVELKPQAIQFGDEALHVAAKSGMAWTP